jgi:DNA-binding NtrC family response regulator
MPSRKILLIDDDPGILEGVGDRLRSYGLEVRCEATAAGCYAALTEEVPDLVLLDIQLPDGDGLDILKDLQARHPALPVLMITSLKGKREEAIRRGAKGFLAKPFRMEDLKREVFLALGKMR